MVGAGSALVAASGSVGAVGDGAAAVAEAAAGVAARPERHAETGGSGEIGWTEAHLKGARRWRGGGQADGWRIAGQGAAGGKKGAAGKLGAAQAGSAWELAGP